MIKLAHVCIETSDLAATERFYACLGLGKQFEFRNRENMLVGFYLKFDNLTFLEVILVRQIRKEGTIRHFAMECENVDEARNALLAAGYEASEKHLGEDNTYMVTCKDPNGVFIELHQYDRKSMQLIGGTCIVDYTP